MREFVPVAHRLGLLAGSAEEARDLAVRISTDGLDALGPFDDGLTLLLREELTRAGIVKADGTPNPARAAGLVVVCDLLTQLPETPTTASPGGRLVFSSPAELYTTPAEHRLDLLVADIIRMAESELHVGSGFWNDQGVDLILEVLQPAVSQRSVKTTLYAHPSAREQVERLRVESANLYKSQLFDIRWYQGPDNSLMHAKFVVADRSRGYLGTANLTSLGFSHHIEVGVELTPDQASELVEFIETLGTSGLFAAKPNVTATPRLDN